MGDIETTDDLVRALRHSREVQEAVRSLVAGDTLQSLTEETREIRKTQTAILEEQKELRREANALRETQNTMLETMGVVLRELTDLRQDSNQLGEDIRTEHRAMDRFRGNYAIDATERNPYGIMQPFGRGHGIRRARYQLLNGDRLQEMVDQHDRILDDLVDEQAQSEVPAGFAVTDDEIGSFREADMVMEVSRRSSEAGSPPEFYLLVEASYTGTFEDVRRACVRAKVLREITGRPVYPVTAAVMLGERLNPALITTDVTDLINSDSRHVAFWHRLSEENLEPPPPR